MNDVRLIDADKFDAVLSNIFDHLYESGRADLAGTLAAFADMLKQQPTIDAVPVPCKIGDVVYGIRNYKGKTTIQKGFVSEMFFTEDMKLMIVVKHVCRGYWGEKVFPTYEAAEAAKRKDGDGNG